MYCSTCFRPNPADAEVCIHCKQNIGYLYDRVFVGQQFIFVQADNEHPVTLEVDGTLQTYCATTILSLHRHGVSFGDNSGGGKTRGQEGSLPDRPRLPWPSLKLLTVVTDRKIYRTGSEAALFIVAPDMAEDEAAVEIQLAGQKVYEAKVTLNPGGLALHRYPDLKEGEYKAIVTLSDNTQAECTFSVAEFTLSPLLAILETYQYTGQYLTFTLKLFLLSTPYSGPVELGLQCQVCSECVVAVQKVKAKKGIVRGQFNLSNHSGPFHVQVITPEGHTALVSFPGTGVKERKPIPINLLGQTARMGLIPWENAQPLRGFYVGLGEVNRTPLVLESIQAVRGRLQVVTDLLTTQLIVFNPRTGISQVIDRADLKQGETLEFDAEAPYTLFTVGAFTREKPFEGWGVVIKPLAFEAMLTVPATAQPGEEVTIHLKTTWENGGEVQDPKSGTENGDLPSSISPVGSSIHPLFCLLLVYDARLEHESLLPKLAKRIYESIREATHSLAAGSVSNLQDEDLVLPGDLDFLIMEPDIIMSFQKDFSLQSDISPAGAARELDFLMTTDKLPEVMVAPIRMEFPEMVHLELLCLNGQVSRKVKLGDQIGTWRVRAYLFQEVDYRELTSDIQVDKPLYAELDLPTIASVGDAITAAVHYHTREPADLIIATPFDRTQTRVQGEGTECILIKGPGRVEVRIENQTGSDWSVRAIDGPGVQKVTASRLMILDQGQTVQGERVVVYPSMGPVLRDTVTALIHYPFG
ncbi:MAG TPA: alpha-2-macroglobulin family protein [Candidatus Limnocylindrales bacterium]|nr:alpha-2-macroglobulin family protein [Candidatus Limnocylindrales bacterium]